MYILSKSDKYAAHVVAEQSTWINLLVRYLIPASTAYFQKG